MKQLKRLASVLMAIALFQSNGVLEAKIENKIQSPSSATLPNSLLLKEKPTNAISVVEAKKQVKKGEKVVIIGDIGGRALPFIEGRAAFILADETNIISCDKRYGDNCKTPWDYCCEDPKKIRESILLVQVLNNQGQVIKESIKGFSNIKELSKVIVVGTYDDSSTEGNVIINASGIYLTR